MNKDSLLVLYAETNWNMFLQQSKNVSYAMWMWIFIDFSVKLTLMIAAELEQKLKMSDTNSKDFQKQLSDLRKALNNAKVRSWVL